MSSEMFSLRSSRSLYSFPSTSSRLRVLKKLLQLALSEGLPGRLTLKTTPCFSSVSKYAACAYCAPRSE